MQGLIFILACCGIATAAVYWSCPKERLTKEDREKVRGQLLAKVKVESQENKGNMDYDLINYKLEYQNIYERWYAVYYYLPNPLKITARTTAGGAVYECPVRLQVGKEYVVGHNGYFRFVLPFDSLKEQDRKLLEHKL